MENHLEVRTELFMVCKLNCRSSNMQWEDSATGSVTKSSCNYELLDIFSVLEIIIVIQSRISSAVHLS